MIRTSRDRVLAVVPVYGHDDLTHALLADLERESSLVDVVVVDNRGDYRDRGHERVFRPGRNLGWAEGTNHGTRVGRTGDHTAFLWINNDTRLTLGFVAGLVRAWRATGAGIVGPFYDCHWLHQRDLELPSVDAYRPTAKHYHVPFIDGTAMFVPASTVSRIGLLDSTTFAPLGWGAEIDYCLSAAAAGLAIGVTRLGYLHHERAMTAQTVFDNGYDDYLGRAYPVAVRGLAEKWGQTWRDRLGVDPSTSQTNPVQRQDRFGMVGLAARHLPRTTETVSNVMRYVPGRGSRVGEVRPPLSSASDG